MTQLEHVAQYEMRRTVGLSYHSPLGCIDVDTAPEHALAYLCAMLGVSERFEDDARALRLRLYASNRAHWVGVLVAVAENRERERACTGVLGPVGAHRYD